MQVCRMRLSAPPPHPLQCSDGRTALKCAIEWSKSDVASIASSKSDVVSFLRSKGAPE